MSSSPVIFCRAVSKCYNIYSKPQDRLKQALFGRWRRYFDEYWALQDVTLAVNAGETLGIIGRNGSGKSTLLQIIAGTLRPTLGAVEAHGRVAALLELGAGFNPEFTGIENVYLAATLLGLTNDQINERLDDIIGFAAIGDFLEQPVKFYSSGMYARLAFAVAAHVDPQILILDEILSVGDIVFTQKCMRFIRKFKERGTLIFVSHDTGAILNLCDRVAWIDRGRLHDVGPTKSICRDYVAAMERDRDDSSSFRVGGRPREAPSRVTLPVRDPRADLLESSNRRNKIEVFDFDKEAPWYGTSHATIVDVAFERPDGERLASIIGGDEVVLRVKCHSTVSLAHPIVGFQIKDRLGQFLFGDNTFLTYVGTDIAIEKGGSLSATFRFQMPYLPSGDYSMVAALVDGDQDNHVVHHWVEEALVFTVHSSHVINGLVGIPMNEITLERHRA